MNSIQPDTRFKHNHSHTSKHSHAHGMTNPSLITSTKGIRCLKWSFVILLITAIIQVVVVLFTGSVALLADTIHNVGDALTAIPLGIAFALARLKPSRQFTYGLGRFEDFAGIFIVAIILFSAVYAGYESVSRFFYPRSVSNLWAVVAASIIGLIGNEIVARYRIKVGKEIGSAALIADGYHARVDGFTSLAVLLGATGIWLGFPLADPIVGIGISLAILRIVWESGKAVIIRFLDGVEPEIIEQIRSTVKTVPGITGNSEIRARWVGHQLHAEINASVKPELSVEQGHEIAKKVKHELKHKIKHLSVVTIHIDPENASGEQFHSMYSNTDLVFQSDFRK